MILRYRPFLLEFRHPFGVSSNTRKETLSVFVSLEAKGHKGYGEACLPAYLGETKDETISFFEKAAPILNEFRDAPLAEILLRIDRLSAGCNAAKAAIDIALHDLLPKIDNVPCYKWLGLSKSEALPTSFTIGIDTPEKTEQKIREAAEFAILKIKAGTPDDKALIALIRRFTDKPLYVDVNQGWKDKELAQVMIGWMSRQNVVLIEQPMPLEMKTEMRELTAQSPIPTIADESVKRLTDLQQLDGAFSGINIKLMKCTGLYEALKMIDHCRSQQLKILLGCMAESSCATSAMAQLMGLANYIDLDAPKLYTNDPFEGISYEQGKVCLNDRPGIGAQPKDGSFI